MRGIISAGAYVPYRRLNRGDIATTFGSGGGKGTRAVAGYDEDTTTLAVEAARFARRSAPADTAIGALWFATANPAYLDKNNASAIHAALRLDSSVPAVDFGGALRSGVGALRAALEGSGCIVVVASDMRDGLPTSADEAQGGDGGAAILVGSDTDGPVIAECIGTGSATEEFIERWRTPGSRRSLACVGYRTTALPPLPERAVTLSPPGAPLPPTAVTFTSLTALPVLPVWALAFD